MILHITNDLMMSSTARSHAKALQVEIKFAANLDDAIETISSGSVQLCLVDLQAGGMDVESLAQAIQVGNIPTVAYAQHVYVDVLEKAKDLEFAEVITRGQFNRNLGQILAQA